MWNNCFSHINTFLSTVKYYESAVSVIRCHVTLPNSKCQLDKEI